MCASFLFADDLGLRSGKAYAIVAGVIGVSALMYAVMWVYNRSRGINLSYAFKELPPE